MVDVRQPTEDVPQVPSAVKLSRPPLPDVIVDNLREDILRGRLRPGEQLPSEPTLAANLGVSRNSLRQAIARMTFEGVLVRERGRGTFVSSASHAVIRSELTVLTSTTELIRSHGYVPGTRGCVIDQVVAPQKVLAACACPPLTRFWHISRTRLASDRPVVHCEDYVPSHLLDMNSPSLAAGDRDWSLYARLEEAGVAPATIKTTVQVTGADEPTAEKLEVKPGRPLLLLKQIHYGQRGELVLYSENWHNSSILEFEIVRRANTRPR